jgi:predicted DNA-binding transcriptional regulator YafY
MNDTLLRHWVMLSQIPVGRGIDTPTLVARLGEAGYAVTSRTVQRDLEKLSKVFPLSCDDTSKPYRWGFAAGARAFSLPGMSPAVALVVRMADAHLASVMPARVRDALGPYVAQADGVLTSAGWDWVDRVRVLPVGPRTLPPTVRQEVLEAVAEAMTARKRLRLEYRKRSAEATATWDLTPLGLVLRAPAVYLVASPEERPLQFALHRVVSAEVLDEKAQPVAEFDLDAYIAASEFGYRLRPDPIRLRLRVGAFSEPEFLERPLASDQLISRDADGALVVEATVHDTMDLRAFLLSFGSSVEVLEPAEVRDQVAAELGAAAAVYGKRLGARR